MVQRASAGHRLGQLIGDWFEAFFVLPLMTKVSKELNLFVDNRFVERPIRGNKIIWQDVDGNQVDYDVVLELNGSPSQLGIPVAFIETFWRRGSRHSKDKARDDSGKLMPMRMTYPTARFLGIVSAGDFTRPARELVRSREINLFYVPKQKIIKAFEEHQLIMDYPDRADEQQKQQIAAQFEANFSTEKKEAVANSLIELIGKATVESYIAGVRSQISALPQEIRFILRQDSTPVVFNSIDEATEFVKSPQFSLETQKVSYLYQITYSDGSEFEKMVLSLDELSVLHHQITVLAEHMNSL